jgi:Uma2 family endonuclease
MATAEQKMATVDDLMGVEGKAELIGGKVVHYMATGIRPNEVAGNIYVSLRAFSRRVGRGKAFTDNVGYAVPVMASGRESFSPDTSYYDGPLPLDLMRFVAGAPTFAVEVRSENSYGPAAEAEQAAKRADYFAAGTFVVWDVDARAETVDCYHASAPDQPRRFTRNDTADAEPAVPGWRITGQEIFA